MEIKIFQTPIKEVHDSYVVMKARAVNLLNARNWTDNRIDWDNHPEYENETFWQDTPFTFFVFCPWDVTQGGENII